MDPKKLGLAFCEDGGLQYFSDYRYEERRLRHFTGVTAKQEVLIITKPNGEEVVIRDMAIELPKPGTKDGKQTVIYRAKDAIYRYPREEHGHRINNIP